MRRRTRGPGPKPILNKVEESVIAEYCAQMGFGLSRDDLLRVAFLVAEKSRRKHPWNGMAGKAGFMSRHPTLRLKSPQPLSHARAKNASDEQVKDFFEKLGRDLCTLKFAK